MNCHTCKWFDEMSGKDNGLCRVEPPKITASATSGVWPMVKASDWCSHYEKK